jgi:nitrogen fixation/metabolism regulation signal transduction histidine kinase
MESWLESFAKTNFRRSSDTAHDLKTPLNVAVLNLELLRMRVSKLAGAEDEKVNGYAKSIESELRRMARIFDSFFVLSTPPRGDEAIVAIDLSALCSETAAEAMIELAPISGSFHIAAHESRIRQAFCFFFEGVSRVLRPAGLETAIENNSELFTVAIAGNPADADFEMTKIFKFYYTDALGNPDLSLASARLIAETYGGALNAVEERDKVVIRLSFPSQT